MTYIVHSLVQESPAQTVGPVLDPKTSAELHATAGLNTLAEAADRRAAANVQLDALDREDADNWRRALEFQYSLDQFNDSRLPAAIIAELARVRSQKLYDRVEVWTRYHWKSRNREVAFVGSVQEYGQFSVYYVIAQWSPNDEDRLTTSEMLRTRVHAHKNPLIAYTILPDRAKIAFAICGALFAFSVIYWNWAIAIASLVTSGISWIAGKLLCNGDDELAELTYVGMALLAIASVVMVVFGAAA